MRLVLAVPRFRVAYSRTTVRSPTIKNGVFPSELQILRVRSQHRSLVEMAVDADGGVTLDEDVGSDAGSIPDLHSGPDDGPGAHDHAPAQLRIRID